MNYLKWFNTGSSKNIRVFRWIAHLIYSCSSQPCRRCKSSSKQGFVLSCTLATEQRSSLYVALLKWSSCKEKNVLYYHPQHVSFDSVCSIVRLKIIFCVLTPCSIYIRKKNQELPDHDPCKRNVWVLWGLHIYLKCAYNYQYHILPELVLQQ